MTGTELFEAMSFVDERFIAEADTAKLGRNVPWMKLISLAACLCIIVTGAFALERMTDKCAETEAAAPAAPMEAAPAATQAAMHEEAAPMEGAPLAPETTAEESLTEDITQAAGELTHIPYAKLRVTKAPKDGSFEAVVEATQEMEVDTQVTVVVDPSKVPGADTEITHDLSWITEGTVLVIEDGAYDAGNGVLYVADVFVETGE